MPKRNAGNKPKPYHFLLQLDDEDKRSFERIVKREKLSRADTLRRLIRAKDRSLRASASQ